MRYCLHPALYEVGAHDLIADYVVAGILAQPPLRQAAAAK